SRGSFFMLGHRNTASNELLREILTPAAALRDHVPVRAHGEHGHWVGPSHCLPAPIFPPLGRVNYRLAVFVTEAGLRRPQWCYAKDLSAAHTSHQEWPIYFFWPSGFALLCVTDERSLRSKPDVACGSRRNGCLGLLLHAIVPAGLRRRRI